MSVVKELYQVVGLPLIGTAPLLFPYQAHHKGSIGHVHLWLTGSSNHRSNPYAGLLIASQLLDPVKVMTEEEYRNAIANRLFPAYDQFVKAHSRDLLERHIKYVGNHTTGTPAHLVPYLLEALSKYEGQLQQTAATPASPQKKLYQRKTKVTEKLPKWAEQTDANERTEGPASEAQIQDSMQALANLRKQQQERRQRERGAQQ